MKRTTEKPTVGGWYFVERPNDSLTALHLTIDDHDGFFLSYWDELKHGDVDYLRDDPPGTSYTGPIPEPSDNYDVYDTLRRRADIDGLGNIGVLTCFQLGYAAYIECLRCGAFFPHHK
jgi:hypothetical protein